jgi:hypothetical protein
MSDSGRAAEETRSIEPRVAALLAKAGRSSMFTLEPLAGGRNNRTYRVRTDAGDSLLKWYFSHHSDDRDRLGSEFDFCIFCWRHGLRQIPRPLSVDRAAGLGLYDFLAGRRLTSGDVTLEHHRQSIVFLQNINALRLEPDALSLANASEACFSLAAHAERIEQRIQRLTTIASNDDIDVEMIEFMRSNVQPAFERERAQLEKWAAHDNLDMRADLPSEDRCLSPSDFGFHNALLQDDGSLRFVDFEYAGWDDPAKLVGDFFCQIERPAVAAVFDDFLESVAQLSLRPQLVVQRSRHLFPLYQIKWCCIVLNEFLPTGGARRSFSAPQLAESSRIKQLAIARHLFDRVGCMPGIDC